MKRPAFLPGVKGVDDARYERKQNEKIQCLSLETHLPRCSLVGIQVDGLRPWIGRRLAELVTFDDEVLVGTVINWLGERTSLEAGELLLLLTPFMGRGQAQTFARELWDWLERARASDTGIPPELAEEYEKLLEKEKREAEETKARAFQRRHLGDRRGGAISNGGGSRSTPARRYYDTERGREKERAREGRRPPSPDHRRKQSEPRSPLREHRGTRYPEHDGYSERKRVPGRRRSARSKSPFRSDYSSSYSTPSRSRSRTRQEAPSVDRSHHQGPPSPRTPSSSYSSDDAEGLTASHVDVSVLAVYDGDGGASLPPAASKPSSGAEEERGRQLQDRARRLMNQD